MALFSVTLGDPKPPHFYCTTACNVMHGIAVTILSVCLSVCQKFVPHCHIQLHCLKKVLTFKLYR